MARVNDVTIRLAADVTKLKTGFSSAGQSVRQLSAQVQALTNGQIKLTSAGRFYDAQRKQFISTAKAEQVISKGLQREYTRTQTAVTAVANATKAAVEAEVQKINASKSLAQISKETIASFSASGNAVQHLTARLVALTKGEYLLTASGQILNATTKQQAAISEVAAAATARLSMEQTNLRAAYGKATAGMDASQKRLLDTQMAMTGLSSITGSASFAAISMGQIFQDMGQFGMGAAQGVRAITNNVQQTVQSLVMLSTMTAKGESVFKAFTTALRGPVGFLVAFSAVTGLIELFSNRAQRASKNAEKLSEAFSSLFSVMKAGDAVSISSAERLKILQDGLIALAEENQAVADAGTVTSFISDQLVTTMTDEAAAAASAADEYRGFAKQLEEQVKSAELFEQALRAREDLLGINGLRVEDLTAKNEELARKIAELAIPMSDEAQALADQNKRLQDQIDLLEFLKDKKENLVADTAERMSEVAADLEKALAEDIDLPDPDKLKLGPRLWTEADDKAVAKLRQAIPYISEFEKEMEALNRAMTRPRGEGEGPANIMDLLPDPETLNLGDALETEADKAEKALERMNRAFQNTVRNGITDMIVGLGELASGEGNVAQKLLLPIADMAIQLGKIAIGTAVALQGIKNAFESLNPAVALAAGVALVALGSAVKSRIKAAGKGASSASSAAARPNFTMPNPLTSPASFSSQGMFPATSNAPSFSGRFVASGRDLVAVVSAETDARQELGFTRNLVIGG